MQYVYGMEHYSALRKEPRIAICQIELENMTLRGVSQAEKEKQDITYMWNLENYTNESVYKTETDSQIQKTNMLVKGESGGSDKSEVWG